MATTPPSSPARRDEPAQLTITSKIELKLLPSSATARKLAFNEDGVLLGVDLYDKCLNLTQPRLPGGQRNRLKLTEHDAPFVLRSGGESLLKTLDVSILHDRRSGVEGDRFTIGDEPLKVTAHKIANDTALLVDPKKNGTLFRHTEAHDLERVVPHELAICRPSGCCRAPSCPSSLASSRQSRNSAASSSRTRRARRAT